MSLKSAIGLSCLSVMTSVCPAPSGEQAIARKPPVCVRRCLKQPKHWSSIQGLQGEGRGLTLQ